LRDRLEDLDELALHFLDLTDYAGPGLDAAARDALASYHWPGNLRELRNVIERAVILAGSAPITTAELHLPARRAADPPAGGAATLLENEERMIRDALARAGGNKSRAARLLGITRRALYGRLERYGISGDAEV
jgi:DNA-binding NtrC family response regulator